jgi:hypothetical protein
MLAVMPMAMYGLGLQPTPRSAYMLRTIARIVCFGVAVTMSAKAQDLEAVQVPGAHIQRTMGLLATSTPEKRNHVRILFYGQSITCQSWWKQVADDLRKRFPNADLDIQNKGIGGFTAPALINTAEYDLYPFYPDLLIFHVYGGGQMDKWESIIRRTRERTAAEVVLWTHHWIGRKGDLAESERIRQIAVKYDCGLVDIMPKWQAALKEKGVEPKAVLRDGIHLNAEGIDMLAGMIKPFFVYNPKLMTEKSRRLVTDIPADAPAVKRLADGSLEVTFTGNRIDAIAAKDTKTGPLATLTVDGKAPAKIDGAFVFTKPSNAPYTWFPAVSVLKHNAPLVAETWTAKFLEFTPDAKKFRYSVTGSVTGPDGEGNETDTFVSNSGRIVIAGGGNWSRVPWSLTYKKKQMPETYKVTWKVVPLFVDTLQFAAAKNPASERSVTLIKGMPNGPHTIRLTPEQGAKLDLAGFRAYCPPDAATE